MLNMSCATSFDKRGRHHTVGRGETIWIIARAYRIDAQTLAEYNNITDVTDFQVGMKLYIPGRPEKPGYKRVVLDDDNPPRATRDRRTERKTREKKKGDGPIEVYHGRFIWPVGGTVTSGFGMRNGRKHEGIDIAASSGTPIKAADAGRVAFAGKMRGYGNLVLIRHDDAFITAYAHNTKNSVKKGELVKTGEIIATVGRTGRATAPNLHFEVRQGQQARNPLFFLPKKKR
ncbi:MAG: hypothetical protein A3I05_09470 [Deltaproteobacteria bacterium RIFCSPLOWO2_02_FULL_44_10]|nr:MAG: hypothetical protein A3C46_07510 [Deltaproteobacteria bacterium RIFCSPHIGHO2_02_FULL_44_16]OGQ47445.1 MAG: hypothetical protein A3I05_09470 [Deltaproteobacteria bacterium RIFCSPLOWO2_02_FULL_44_10]